MIMIHAHYPSLLLSCINATKPLAEPTWCPRLLILNHEYYTIVIIFPGVYPLKKHQTFLDGKRLEI
jgi:hypothetical protein